MGTFDEIAPYISPARIAEYRDGSSLQGRLSLGSATLPLWVVEPANMIAYRLAYHFISTLAPCVEQPRWRLAQSQHRQRRECIDSHKFLGIYQIDHRQQRIGQKFSRKLTSQIEEEMHWHIRIRRDYGLQRIDVRQFLQTLWWRLWIRRL